MTRAPKRTIHTQWYEECGKLNSTSGGPRSAIVPGAKIHLYTQVTHTDNVFSLWPACFMDLCCTYILVFFSFLTIWNEGAEESSNFAFTTIRKSTGLFSQAVSSAQLVSSPVHPTHTTSSAEFLSQYSTSLTTSVCITTSSGFGARFKFESNQTH